MFVKYFDVWQILFVCFIAVQFMLLNGQKDTDYRLDSAATVVTGEYLWPP